MPGTEGAGDAPMHDLLNDIAHRPWPVPSAPWIMEQTWRDLLFAHWSYPVAEMQAALPPGLTLDVFDDKAWIGVVPFLLDNLHARGLPGVPTATSFPELNVRTYVTVNGKPGVYFFSLDAASKLAVIGARTAFGLNYFDAEMSIAQTPSGIAYKSRRTDPRGSPAVFRGRYAPIGEALIPQAGTLEHFLVERYCLYSVSGAGSVHRLEIHHRPWLLQTAEADIEAESMLTAAGVTAPRGDALLQFSSIQPMIAWAPEPVA